MLIHRLDQSSTDHDLYRSYAMREKVEAELNRLRQQGIIELVQFSDWAALINILFPS